MSGPFDKARYEVLLKGLEITEIFKSALIIDNAYLRFDSEFQQKKYYIAIRETRRNGSERFGMSSPLIIHPGEIPRDYVEQVTWLFRSQNLRAMCIDESDKVFISSDDASLLTKNRIKNGDVVLTRSGANRGDCAFFDSPVPAIASSHTFIVRSKKWNHAFLVAFFNSKYGKLQIDKGVYGGAQPEIAPYYLKGIWIPSLSKQFQMDIEHVFRNATVLKQKVIRQLITAEKTLLTALGLKDWRPPEPLTYTCGSKDVFEAGRFDSQYFAPRVAQLLACLGKDKLSISDVAPPRIEKFTPLSEGMFRYIEISDLQNNGTTACGIVEMKDAPSRATWTVRAGDVITSTVRPNRRLSALITPEQDGCVASSGFVVLQPKNIDSEVLLTYLRLPVFCELMDLHTSASLYPAISDRDLLSLPFPKVAPIMSKAIIKAVRSAHGMRQQAQVLLARAQHAVELAIEENELSALRFLNEKGV